MRIIHFSTRFSKKLLCFLVILGVGPLSLVAANPSRWLPLRAPGYLSFLSLPTQSQSPRLLTRNNSNRALSLDASTFRAEPFALTQLISFGSDRRTRLLLFATNIDVAPGENPLVLTVDAEDSYHRVYPLQVEYVDRVAVSEAMYAIHVRLNDEMTEDGDVLIRLYFNGIPSNRVRVGLGHVGGGLPDDGASQIHQLSPSTAMAGESGFTLSISGSNFTPDVKPFFNGIQHAATVASENLLLVPLSSSDLQMAGSYAVHVQSSAGVSNSISFSVSNPQPAITNLSPSNVIKGGTSFTLSVNGFGFVQGSVVNFNGRNRVTAFVSATLLTAQILASDVAGAGSFPVKVLNATPGGGSSSALLLVVAEPVPSPTPTPTPAPTVVPYQLSLKGLPGLWGYWRFGEPSGTVAADASGNSRHLTYQGNPTLAQTSLLTGDANTSVLFNGTSQYANRSTGLTTTTGLTVSMLVKFTSTSGTQGLFGTNDHDNPAQPHHNLTLTGGTTLTWRWTDGTAVRAAAIGVSFVSGRKHHIVVSHTFGSQVLFIIDGVTTTVTATTSVSLLSNDGVRFGNRPSCCSTNGTIDEAAVWTKALTTSEAQRLFRSARGIDSAVNNFIVSPVGTYDGAGTAVSPIDWVTATNWGLGTADTIFQLRGNAGDFNHTATGTSAYKWRVSGTSGHPVVITNYTAESPKIDLRDTVCNSSGGGCASNGIYVNASYVRFQNLEIYNSNTLRRDGVTTRTSTSDGTDPGDTERGDEIAFNMPTGSVGVEIINSLIHDVGTGIFNSSGSNKHIVYGNLIYNVGWKGPTADHGPALYLHNEGPDKLIVKHNLFFNGLKSIHGQIRSTQTESVIENIDVIENASYNGSLSVLKGTPNNITFDGNQIFGAGMTFGENDAWRKGVGVVRNNYIYAKTGGMPVELNYWDTLTVTNNVFVAGTNGSSRNIALRQLTVAPAQTNHAINGNKYYDGRNLGTDPAMWLETMHNGAAASNNYKTWSQWRAAGRDVGGVRTSPGPATPTLNVTKISPNAYRSGRANIVIWNWQKLPSLPVNLSQTGLIEGQSYQVRNAYNWNAGPVLSGVYHAATPIAVLTPTTDRAPWIGQEGSTPVVSIEFQLFVVVPIP